MHPSGPAGPRKLRRFARAAALILLAAVAAGCSGGSIGSGTAASAPASRAPAAPSQVAMFKDPNGLSCLASEKESSGYCPGDDPTPAPAVNPATKVTFVVTGTGEPSITYGSDSDNRDGGGTLGELGEGNALPWTRSLHFSGAALYYFMDAQLEGAGDISCKIVVAGPGDDPLTVASGHADGGYNICSAQAAPSDPSGTSWQAEG
jgi:hypothetical protein